MWKIPVYYCHHAGIIRIKKFKKTLSIILIRFYNQIKKIDFFLNVWKNFWFFLLISERFLYIKNQKDFLFDCKSDENYKYLYRLRIFLNFLFQIIHAS